MNTTNRLWQVVAAVGLALLAVLLTTFYVTNYKRHVQHADAQVTVIVAAKDIPVDTQGAELQSGGWLGKESIPRREVVPGAISSPVQLRNLIATEPIYAGEQVTTRRFGTPSERGVRALIHGTQRAVEFDGDAHQLLAGTLRAGDHVDIVGAWTTINQDPVSRVIVRDALVLSAPAAPSKSTSIGPGNAFSVQLRVSDTDSQKIEFVYAHGKNWRLEIRPAVQSANSPRSYVNGTSLLQDGPGAR
jgi:Flp pilus assembly protein CpaB